MSGTPSGGTYFIKCDSCGVVLHRKEIPRQCPTCERITVATGHQAKPDDRTTFSNITELVV